MSIRKWIVCGVASLVSLGALSSAQAAEQRLTGYRIFGYDKKTDAGEVRATLYKLINSGKETKIVVLTGTHGDGAVGNLGDPTFPGASVASFTREDIASINTLSKGKNVTVTFQDVSKYQSNDPKVREKKGGEILQSISTELSGNATAVLGWCYSACWSGLKNYGRKTDCTP